MRHELVSIIVPVYNSEAYLPRCIESILNQSYFTLEIILVNDGSTDNSGKICDGYAYKDSRIKVIHKDNGGQQDARSRGIAIAKGDYIGFVDSDDWIDKDMFENLVEMIEDHDLVTTGIWRHDKTGDIIGTWIDPLPEGEYRKKCELKCLYENLIIYSHYDNGAVIGGICNNLFCKLFRSAVIKEMYQDADIFIKNAEDYLFCLLYELRCNSIKITHNCYYHYMENEKSVSCNANLNYLREQNDFYLTVDQALKGHWMEKSLRSQFQKRFMYSILAGMKRYMNFAEEIGIPSYAYPFGDKLDGKRIVLFGAGKVGRSYFRDVKIQNTTKVVLWVDNYPPEELIMDMRIEPPHKALDIVFDYIICAVLKEGQAKIIKNQLIELGIKESKILWREPMSPLMEVFLKQ